MKYASRWQEIFLFAKKILLRLIISHSRTFRITTTRNGFDVSNETVTTEFVYLRTGERFCW